MSLQVDSRKIKAGDTFIALKNIKRDGHDYIEEAIKNGATKIIAEQGFYSVETKIVDNTRKYLATYLKNEYGEKLGALKLIAFTGTNGKTSSSRLLHQALNKLGRKAACIGSTGFYIDKKVKDLNNSTPDLFEMYELLIKAKNSGCEYVAFEASSQGLDQGRLLGIDVDYAVFTNLTHDHLDAHGTIRNYAKAKQTLFKMLKPDGKALINKDDKWSDFFELEENNNIGYGKTKSDYQIMDIDMRQDETIFNLNGYFIDVPFIGEYNIYNLTTAIAILKEEGFLINQIKKVTKKLSLPEGRLEIVMYGDIPIIIDYAHTPDAIEKIIALANDKADGVKKIITVMGCTGDRDKTKRSNMTEIALEGSSKVIITSDDNHSESFEDISSDMVENIDEETAVIIIEDRKQAIKEAFDKLNSGDIFLVIGKGSDSYEGNKKINDRKIIEELIEESKQTRVVQEKSKKPPILKRIFKR